jgi:uncharacterized repeat protein (TIGR03803 family)
VNHLGTSVRASAALLALSVTALASVSASSSALAAPNVPAASAITIEQLGRAPGIGGTPSHLIQARNGHFYGTTDNLDIDAFGESESDPLPGGIFEVLPSGVRTLKRFPKADANGNRLQVPSSGLVQARNGDFYGFLRNLKVTVVGTTFSFTEHYSIYQITYAGTFKTIHSFPVPKDFLGPSPDLTLGPDGALYGATDLQIFRINTAGTVKVLHTFDPATEGHAPDGALLLGHDGSWYGTTSTGGPNGGGTVFRLTQKGAFTVLRALPGPTSAGFGAEGPLLQDAHGNLFGSTTGFVNDDGVETSKGSVFELTPGGTFSTLHSFSVVDDRAGGYWVIGGLAWGPDGAIYGTTHFGPTTSAGLTFRLTTAGAYEVLGPDIAEAPLTLGTDGFFYGGDTARFAPPT